MVAILSRPPFVNTLVRLWTYTWWHYQMEIFSALLAICVGNSPVPGEFTAQRPVTRSFDVFFDLRLNKRLSKQSRGTLMKDIQYFILTGIILYIHPANERQRYNVTSPWLGAYTKWSMLSSASSSTTIYWEHSASIWILYCTKWPLLPGATKCRSDDFID